MAATGDENENNKPSGDVSDLMLPISRIRTIMKSSPDVENISLDALWTVTAVTVSIII